MFAAEIRRKRVAHMRRFTHWRWHLDEVYVKINGEMRYLWRAVDHEGEVLESFVTKDAGQGRGAEVHQEGDEAPWPPRGIVTDGLRSYQAAMNEIGNADRQEIGRWLNNRAENSTCRSDDESGRCMRFRRMKTLQKFGSVHASVHNHFNQERHLVDREIYKERRSAALAEWRALAA